MDGPVEPEVRELSAAWLARIEELAEEMLVHLAGQLPVIAEYPELRGLTKASCSSNVEAILSMMLNDIPASATEAPVTALEHARALAKRGSEVDDLLRFYRLGHAHIARQWVAALADHIADRDRLLRAIAQTTEFMALYVDVVSSRVSAEHLAERERRQRRTTLMRADVVRTLLEGGAVDRAAAERVLGVRLDRPQLAFVCWSPEDGSRELERAALRVAEVIGDPRPLLVAEGPHAIGGWVSPPRQAPVDRGAIQRALRRAHADVAVAFGTVQPGLDGFRRSRREADRARRVAALVGDGAGARIVRFDDVALLDLLTADLDAARAFVQAELAGLARPDEATEAVRRTMVLVLAPRGGTAAAARELDVHRNTVLQRVHRAESLLGRPVTERPTELHLALLLAERLGPHVL